MLGSLEGEGAMAECLIVPLLLDGKRVVEKLFGGSLCLVLS